MTQRRKWIAGTGAVLVAGGVAIAVALAARSWAAGEAGAGLGLLSPELAQRPLGRMLRENVERLRSLKGQLNITGEQKEEIKKVLQSHRAEMVAVAKEVRAQHKKVVAAVQAEPSDEAAIRRATQEMAKALGDAAVLHAKVRREVRAKLTPEQREKADACQQEISTSVDRALDEAAKQ